MHCVAVPPTQNDSPGQGVQTLSVGLHGVVSYVPLAHGLMHGSIERFPPGQYELAGHKLQTLFVLVVQRVDS